MRNGSLNARTSSASAAAQLFALPRPPYADLYLHRASTKSRQSFPVKTTLPIYFGGVSLAVVESLPSKRVTSSLGGATGVPSGFSRIELLRCRQFSGSLRSSTKASAFQSPEPCF